MSTHKYPFLGHKDIIPVSVENLIAQYRNSAYKQTVGLRLFLVDTDVFSHEFDTKLLKAIRILNEDVGIPIIELVSAKNAARRSKENKLYGYDDSDMLLEYVLAQPSCKWIMFTNGISIFV